MVLAEFSPFTALAGGMLIGAAAVLLMLVNGRIMGIAGIVGGLLSGLRAPDTSWRLAFVAGLLVPAVVAGLSGGLNAPAADLGLPVLLGAGFLVGLGTRMANGCTSGHGICGLSRLSKRSLAAVATFMAACGVTVYVSRHLWGA